MVSKYYYKQQEILIRFLEMGPILKLRASERAITIMTVVATMNWIIKF